MRDISCWSNFCGFALPRIWPIPFYLLVKGKPHLSQINLGNLLNIFCLVIPQILRIFAFQKRITDRNLMKIDYCPDPPVTIKISFFAISRTCIRTLQEDKGSEQVEFLTMRSTYINKCLNCSFNFRFKSILQLNLKCYNGPKKY